MGEYRKDPKGLRPEGSPSLQGREKDPLKNRGKRIDALRGALDNRKAAERAAVTKMTQKTDIELLAKGIEALLLQVPMHYKDNADGVTVELAQEDLETLALARNHLVIRYAAIDDIYQKINQGIKARKRLNVLSKGHEDDVKADAESRTVGARIKSFFRSFTPEPVALIKKQGREVELVVVRDENEQGADAVRMQMEQISALQRQIEDAMSHIRAWIRAQPK